MDVMPGVSHPELTPLFSTLTHRACTQPVSGQCWTEGRGGSDPFPKRHFLLLTESCASAAVLTFLVGSSASALSHCPRPTMSSVTWGGANTLTSPGCRCLPGLTALCVCAPGWPGQQHTWSWRVVDRGRNWFPVHRLDCAVVTEAVAVALLLEESTSLGCQIIHAALGLVGTDFQDYCSIFCFL